MSSTHLETALVVPFEQLRMTDVDTVGGKNSSLGEMISQLAASKMNSSKERRILSRSKASSGGCAT